MARAGILDRLEEAGVEQDVLGPNVAIRLFRARTPDELADDVSDMDVVSLWHHLAVDSATLERLRNARAIVRVGVGFDNVDLDAAGRLGIPVVNIPDYGTNDVADHALALLLAMSRGLQCYESALRRDLRTGWNPAEGGRLRRLTDRRLGLIGFGRIGAAVAHRARAFGMDVSFYDPYLPAGVEKSWQVKRFRTLEALLQVSDIVSLHTPSTSETRSIINADTLSLLPEGAMLINTARGNLVEVEAVSDALRSGQLAAFGADVLPQEPPEPTGLFAAYVADEDWLRGRLILTPHAAIQAEECILELRRKAAEAMADALAGRPLINCVNRTSLQDPRTPVAQTASDVCQS